MRWELNVSPLNVQLRALRCIYPQPLLQEFKAPSDTTVLPAYLLERHVESRDTGHGYLEMVRSVLGHISVGDRRSGAIKAQRGLPKLRLTLGGGGLPR
jgi:hypothetical protein